MLACSRLSLCYGQRPSVSVRKPCGLFLGRWYGYMSCVGVEAFPVLPASMLILDVTPSDLSRPGLDLGLGCMLRTFLGVYSDTAENL